MKRLNVNFVFIKITTNLNTRLTLSSSSSRFIPPTESKTNSCSPAASIHSSSFSSLRPDVVFSSGVPEVTNVTYIMCARFFRLLVSARLFTLKYILRGDDFRLFRLFRSLFFLSVEEVVNVVGHSYRIKYQER